MDSQRNRSVARPTPNASKSTIAVIIATRGRPHIAAGIVQRLLQQSLTPNHIFVVGSQPSDIAQVAARKGLVTAVVGRIGSAHQRNDGLALAGSVYDYIVFFDDDFVPSHFWLERMAQIFDKQLDVVGVNGVILDDGTTTAGIGLADADEMVRQQDRKYAADGKISKNFAYGGNVGCNMAYRNSAIGSIRFDENLPRYAWHEDSDFRGQVQRKGSFAKAWDLSGVHLGHKDGRSSGLALGYAQIANSIYLARKGTVPKIYMTRLAIKNVAANALRSFAPEPYVDRRGRLKGNFMALTDLVRGKMSPNRILDM